jgi:hypothetical protein
MYKDNTNEKMKRKTSPKNSTKRGFSVIPRVLNRHYRDLRRLNKYQIPPRKHQTKKTGKEKGVRDCFTKKSIYTQLAVRQPVCIRDCQAKRSVYDLNQGQAREKGWKLRPRVNRRCQEMIRQEPQ